MTATVTITGPAGATIRYGFSNNNLDEQGTLYSEPFDTESERSIYAVAIVNGVSSEVRQEYLATADDH
jgi:hypothetical protein